MKLALRPEKRFGSDEDWDKAEAEKLPKVIAEWSATPPAGSGSGERDADAVMRAWWAAQRAAGRTPSGAELDRACGRDPRNGSGRNHAQRNG